MKIFDINNIEILPNLSTGLCAWMMELAHFLSCLPHFVIATQTLLFLLINHTNLGLRL